MTFRFAAVLALSLATAAPADAQRALYSCETRSGGVTYTTTPNGTNCRRIRSFERQQPQRAPSRNSQIRRGGGKVVPPQTQRQRDQTRYDILQHELLQEHLHLERIRSHILATPPDQKAVIARLREQMRVHALNLRAIHQELARL